MSTHIEALQAGAVGVKGGIVEVSKLLCDSLDVGHGGFSEVVIFSCAQSVIGKHWRDYIIQTL